MNATTLQDIAPPISSSHPFDAHTEREIETGYRDLVIAYYVDEVQALILDRIVMPTIDRRFDSLCHEMAGFLGCHVSEAVQILAPAVRELYQAAQEKADQRRPS